MKDALDGEFPGPAVRRTGVQGVRDGSEGNEAQENRVWGRQFEGKTTPGSLACARDELHCERLASSQFRTAQVNQNGLATTMMTVITINTVGTSLATR